MILLDLTSFIICSLQAIYVQFHTRAVCLMCVFLCVFPLCLEMAPFANALCLLCPSGSLAVNIHCSPPALDTRDLSMCAESHTETLWFPGHFSIVHSLQPFFYRCSFQASGVPPTHAWFSWAPFSLIPWFFPVCHPAGSLPPFQLGCSRTSWHKEHLPLFSTNFPSCLSYKKYGQKCFNRAWSDMVRGESFKLK